MVCPWVTSLVIFKLGLLVYYWFCPF